jgi:hypothetical protein
VTLLEALGAFALFILVVLAIGFTFGGWKFSAEIVKDED